MQYQNIAAILPLSVRYVQAMMDGATVQPDMELPFTNFRSAHGKFLPDVTKLAWETRG